MDEFNGWQQGGVGGLVLSIVAGILWLRKRVSNDNKEIAGDRSEIARIKAITVVDASLVEERDKASRSEEEAWTAYNGLIQEVGELRASNKFLTADNMRQAERIKRLERRLGISFDTTDITKGTT